MKCLWYNVKQLERIKMSIIPEYNNSNFLRTLAMYKQFSPAEDRGISSVAGGYLLVREFDGAVWGTLEPKTCYLFMEEEEVKMAAKYLGKDWKIKEIVCFETKDLKKKVD